MTCDELKESISFLFDDTQQCHIIVYTVDVADEVRTLDISQDVLPEIAQVFIRRIDEVFNNDNYNLLNYSTADQRNGCYYIYDIEEKPEKMKLMAAVIGNAYPMFNFQNDSMDMVKALIVVLSSANGEVVSLFKPLSDVEKFLRRKDFIIYESNHRFVRNNFDMIRISPGFQMIYVNGNYVMLQPHKMEKMIGLDKVLINESIRESQRLQHKNLIEDIAQLTCYCKTNPNFCKLLLSSIKKSPLFDINNLKSNGDTIAHARNVNKKFRGDGRFHFNARGDKFVIQNKLQAERFLHLINDDYLKSEFTQGLFETLAKNKL